MKNFNKLVRDKIPEIIQADGETPRTRVLGEEEYQAELIRKLYEEVGEFAIARNVHELADILEVVMANAKVIGSTFEEVERVRIEKATDRGAFENRTYLISTD